MRRLPIPACGMFSRIFTLSCWMALRSSSESSNRYQFRAAGMAFLPSGGRFFSEICPLSSGSPVTFVISGKADPCTVFPEMQIAFIVDKVDRFFYLLHQHPPSNSSENLLRPSGSSAQQDGGIVGLALGALAVLQADTAIPQQLVRHSSIQTLAQTLKERIVLPQHETARVDSRRTSPFHAPQHLHRNSDRHQ